MISKFFIDRPVFASVLAIVIVALLARAASRVGGEAVITRETD